MNGKRKSKYVGWENMKKCQVFTWMSLVPCPEIIDMNNGNDIFKFHSLISFINARFQRKIFPFWYMQRCSLWRMHHFTAWWWMNGVLCFDFIELGRMTQGAVWDDGQVARDEWWCEEENKSMSMSYLHTQTWSVKVDLFCQQYQVECIGRVHLLRLILHRQSKFDSIFAMKIQNNKSKWAENECTGNWYELQLEIWNFWRKMVHISQTGWQSDTCQGRTDSK